MGRLGHASWDWLATMMESGEERPMTTAIVPQKTSRGYLEGLRESFMQGAIMLFPRVEKAAGEELTPVSVLSCEILLSISLIAASRYFFQGPSRSLDCHPAGRCRFALQVRSQSSDYRALCLP